MDMDTSAICESIEILLKKLTSLDEDHLNIPFISDRIMDLKDKLIFVETLPVEETDPDLSWTERREYKLKRECLLNEIFYDPDLSWEEENKLRIWPTRPDTFLDVKGGCWPNAGLLTCFVYCSLYPKGHIIIREDLINQWLAQEFFGRKAQLYDAAAKKLFLLSRADKRFEEVGDADEDLEEMGNQYFDEMLFGGVFQEVTYAYDTTSGDDGQGVVYSCVMHPLAYDAARRIAAGLVAVHDNVVGDKSITPSTKYVALCNLHDTKTNWLQLEVTTLMLFDSHSPSLEKSNYWDLKVLSSTSRSSIEELRHNYHPDKLRYLRLSLDKIIESSPNHLFYTEYLQTLSVDHSNIISINCCMSKWLRHLYLTSTGTSLDLSRMKFLRILELSSCKHIESLSQGMENFTFLRILRIFYCPKLTSLPDTLEGLTRIKELVVHNCRRLDLLKGNAMKALPRLRYLELIGLPKLLELPSGLKDAGDLRYMMIANCTRLKSLTDQLVENLQSLQRLCINKCPELTALPNGIRGLTQLQSLHITQCPTLVSRYARETDEWPTISHIPDIVLQPECTKTVQVEQHKPIDSSCSPAKDPHSHRFVPFFALKTQMAPDTAVFSGGILEDINEYRPWKLISAVLKAVFRMRALLKERKREIEKQLEKQLQKEHDEFLKEKKLHCRLFPHDYEIEGDTLVQLWMAGGLLEETRETPMESVGNRCIDMMVEDEFLSSLRVDTLSGKQMYKHNLDTVQAFMDGLEEVDGLFFIKAKDVDFDLDVIGYEVGVDKSTKHLHLSVLCDSINETKFESLKKITELRTLLFVHNYGSSLTKVPYDMFIALRNLHTLDLSGSHISELPSSIGYVTELRFLDLSFTLIEELPESLGCLLQLQTLKLQECKRLFTLPSSTRCLVNLRHLDFDVLGQLSSMPAGIGALTELRTLSAFVLEKGNGHDIRQLNTLNNLGGSFCISGLETIEDNDAAEARLRMKIHLTHLQLRWNPNYSRSKSNEEPHDNIAEQLRPNYSSLKDLLMLNFPGNSLPGWMGDAQFVSLANIRLTRCENVELGVTLGIYQNSSACTLIK